MHVDFSVDTIAAIATPPGRGGIGVIRVSGPKTWAIAQAIIGFPLAALKVFFRSFLDAKGQNIDQGIAFLFKGPNSFTGEDVLELQAHGGPYILATLLQRVTELGARLARPGEFSERAFINGKIDLVQAESIVDMINASSSQAAKMALASLQGVFSRSIQTFNNDLIYTRMNIEAHLDFPEEMALLENGFLSQKITELQNHLEAILLKATQSQTVQDGVKLVILGHPNAGKSSLINQLAGFDLAMVTNQPGTTRDLIRTSIEINGIKVDLVDTAGLRASSDSLEQMGIERALTELHQAQHILFVIDSTQAASNKLEIEFASWWSRLPKLPMTIFLNKIDALYLQ